MLVTVWANAQFCNKYADKAVAQYKTAKSNNLPNINWPVWSDDWKGHYNWCKTVSEDVATKQTVLRESYLNKYIQKTANIPLHKDRKENTEANDVTLEVLKGVVKSQPKLQTKTVIVAKTPDVNVVPSVTTIPFYTDRVQLLSSEKYTVGHNLSKGSTVYKDRNFLYWEIPAKLKGLDYLITSNRDKFTSGDHLFTIKDPRELTVYIAIDPRITPPSWMIKNGYNNTYEKIKFWIPDNNTYLSFNVFQKNYKKGEAIVFGGNQNAQNQKQCGMYLVFFNTKIHPSIKLYSADKNKDKLSGYASIKVSKLVGKIFEDDHLVSKSNVIEDAKDNRICSTQKRQLKASNNTFFLLDDQRSGSLFPGNILSISDIESGNYKSAITPQRRPYRISTDISGLTKTASATVKDANLADFRNAKTQLLNKTNFNATIGAKAKLGTFKSTNSEVDFNIKVSGGVNYLLQSGGFSFAYNKTNKKYRYVVEIEKIYYNIDFTPEEDFFVKQNIPKNPDWLYVSNVRYGTKLILSIESDYSLDNVKSAMEYRYNGGIISGGGKVAVKYRKTLKNTEITPITLGEQPAEYLSKLIQDPTGKTFAEAFAYDKIDANTQLYPLSYTLRYVEDNAVATIETYASYNQQICSKRRNIIRIEVKDVFVARSDDQSSQTNGEELFGWLKIIAPGYGETTVFDRGEDEHWPETVGGRSPLQIRGKRIFYLQYRDRDLNNPDLYIELNGHLMEDDSGGDDDFGYTSHKYKINDLASGAAIDSFLEEDVLYSSGTSNQNYPCHDGCKAMLFSDGDSRVIIRYTIDMIDKLPSDAKIGF